VTGDVALWKQTGVYTPSMRWDPDGNWQARAQRIGQVFVFVGDEPWDYLDALYLFDPLVYSLKMNGRVFGAFLISSPAIGTLSPSRR